MLRNMRKSSLAIGSAATLAFTGLASVPAANAADMDITSLYGSTLIGAQAAATDFDAGIVLNGNTGLTGATGIAGDTDAADTTHWLVEIVTKPGAETYSDIAENNDLTDGTVPSTATAENDIQFWVGDGTAFATGRTPTGVGSTDAPSATATSFVIDGADGISNNLRIAATFAEADGDEADLQLTVTQFLDLDNDNRNDDGKAGTPVTVTLKADDAVTFTPTFDFAEIGDDAISGTISSNVNLENLWELELSSADASDNTYMELNLDSDNAGTTAASTFFSLTDVVNGNPAVVGTSFEIETTESAANDTFQIELAAGDAALVEVGNTVEILNLNDAGANELDGPGTVSAKNGNILTITTTADLQDDTGVVVDDGNGATIEFNTLSYDSATGLVDWNFGAHYVGEVGAEAGDVIAAHTYTADIDIDATDATNDAEAGFFATDGDASADKQYVDNSINNLEVELEQGASNFTGNNNSLLNARNSEVLEDTTEMDFTVTAWTDAAQTTNAGSDIDIQVTLTDNGLGDTVLTAEGETLQATGSNTASFVLTSDLQGQAEFTVTAADGMEAGDSFQLDVTAEGVSITQQTITWAEEDFTLVQYPAGNFSIEPGGELTVEYLVRNQFNEVPSGNYQLAVTRGTPTGARAASSALQANWSYAVPVSDTGRSSITITDNGSLTTEGGDTVTVQLQESAVAGGGYVNTDAADNDTFTLTYETDMASLSASSLVNSNGVAIGATEVGAITLETETLVDVYTTLGDSDPEYDDTNADTTGNDTPDALLRLYGKVVDADNDGVSAVAVEISADGMNFANANTSAGATQMLNDSIVVKTDAQGDYEVWVRSAVSGKQTINVDAQGATSSVDVTFVGSTGTADSMTLDLASSVVDGRTADVKATVVDAFGNPVSGLTVTFKEEGPGYLNTATGTTDAEGEVIVNLITLSGDTGTSTISATATIDGESTTVSDTITVGTVAAEQKVNAGSFKGYVAVYARGYEGQRLSAKIGNDWVIVDPIVNNESDDLHRTTDFTGAGVDIAVRIYIDRVLVDTINLTTK